jgi:hypothetical protein
MLSDFDWCLLDATPGLEFCTSDHPVVHWEYPGHPDARGVGLANNARTTFPVSPTKCLELVRVTAAEPPSTVTYRRRAAPPAEMREIWIRQLRAAHTHVVMTREFASVWDGNEAVAFSSG